MKLIDIIVESVIDMGEVYGKKLTKDEFINKSKKIWGDRYDYSNVNYYSSHVPVKIKCLKHDNEFQQRPTNHLNGFQGCKYCVEKPDRFITLSDFIERSNKVHKNKYNYDKVVMGKKNTQKVIINCPKHGDFLQGVDVHLRGSGCPNCNESKGEYEIGNILKLFNIQFKRQHTFNDCVNTKEGDKRCKKLLFDFYIPSKNMCIEFDGIQHFEPVNNFGGYEKFNRQLLNDKLKDEYCKKMGIKLVRISYKEFKNIEQILKTELN